MVEPAERFYAEALNALGLAVVITDLAGRVTFWNSAAVDLYGYTAEEASGELAMELIVPLTSRAQANDRRTDVADGRTFAADWEVHDKEGRRIVVHGVTSVIRDVKGQPIASLSAAQDVTAQRALESRASQLAAIVDGSDDAIIQTDLDSLIRSTNPGVEAIFGFRPDELVGQDLALIVPADRRDELAPIVAEILAGRPHRSVTTTRLHKDGSSFHASVRLSAVRDENGAVIGISGITRDVSAEVRTRKLLEASESRYRSRFEQSGMPQTVLDLDGVVISANAALGRLLGVAPEDLEGRSSQGFRHPSDAGGEHEIALVRTGVSDATTWERVLSLADGTPVPVLVQACVLRDAAGAPYAVECFMQDISGTHRARQDLLESEASYRAIVETAQEGIWTSSPDGRTTYANQKLAEILGLSLTAITSRSLGELLGASSAALAARASHSPTPPGAEQHEVTYRHPDGYDRILRVSVNPLRLDDGAHDSLSMVTDITEERRAEKELRRRALYDELTGLPNRSLLTDRLHLAVTRAKRMDNGSVGLLFIDLDRFKLVNDSWGHDAGDQLLQGVARRLTTVVRQGDTVARFGGDEFVVIREGASEADARELAARIQQVLTDAFDLAGQRSYISASIGIAVSSKSTAEELLRFADIAMYEAKSGRHGHPQVFDLTLGDQASGRLTLGRDLREALTSDGLELHYQPQIDLATGRVVGVEALARWKHPTRGWVPPVEFVSVAESLGMAGQLDRWALERSCRDLRTLRGSTGPHMRVSVNVSAMELWDGDLEASALAALQRYGLSWRDLELEITESAIMDRPDDSTVVLQRLRGRGVTIAIDDFGTGYSSLGYLSRLPATSVKIDRSFVRNITDDPDSVAIVTSIIDLCRALRLTTVAEGIETVEQLTLLHRLGCTAGQGFLWSPAVPADDFTALLGRLPQRRFDVTRIPGPEPEARIRPGPSSSAMSVRGGDTWVSELSDLAQFNLSPRETEIVLRLARGKRVPAIAAELFLSQGTVRNQLSAVYRKVGISSQQELLDLINPQP